MVQKTIYGKRCSKELPPLETGQKVRMQKDDKWVAATVISKHRTPRSYVVETDGGASCRRSRRHLRESQSVSKSTETNEELSVPEISGSQSPLDSGPSTNSEDTSNEVVRTRYGRTSVPPTRYQSNDFSEITFQKSNKYI